MIQNFSCTKTWWGGGQAFESIRLRGDAKFHSRAKGGTHISAREKLQFTPPYPPPSYTIYNIQYIFF